MNTRKLDRIFVRNFKSIRELDLELKALNVLVGANGSGKSNFISLFTFLNRIVNEDLQAHTGKAGGANSLLYFGRKISDSLMIKLEFANKTNGYELILEPTDEDSFLFQDERIWVHDKSRGRPYSEQSGSGHRESFLRNYAEKHGRIAKDVFSNISSWKLYHFHDTSESAKVKLLGDLHDNIILRPGAGNLAAFLYRLQRTDKTAYDNIEQTIKLVAPFFDRFQLQPSRLNEDKIRLEWKEMGSDAYFNASALSDGTLRFMCLATLLLQPALPSVILVDEPELGLHPYAITILAEMLRMASQKTQIVVATQSVTLVNQFQPEDILVVERQGNQSVFKHLEPSSLENWLEDYGLGDIWEKNIFGGRP
jgi:predicted ATPase